MHGVRGPWTPATYGATQIAETVTFAFFSDGLEDDVHPVPSGVGPSSPRGVLPQPPAPTIAFWPAAQVAVTAMPGCLAGSSPLAR